MDIDAPDVADVVSLTTRMSDDADDADDRLYEAVRGLIDLASSAPDGWSFVGDTVRLLDTEIEGVRCTLERIEPAQAMTHSSLSPREQEIAQMLAQGMSNKAIALALDISTFTVASHLRRIFVKLDCSNRAGVVGTLAQERGSRGDARRLRPT